MSLMDLTILEILQGILSLLLVIIFTIAGLKIASKYLKYERKELLTAGFSIFFEGSGWWSSAFSFVTYILFDYTLESVLYFFFHGFIGLGLIFWMYSFCLLVYPHMKKQIVSICSAIYILWEIFFIYFLIIDPSIIGTLEGKFDASYYFFDMSFQVFILILTLITFFMLFRHCQRSNNPKIRWQGRFLLIAVISITIGVLLDSGTPTPLTVTLARLLLMLGTFEMYLGWLMPERVAGWLIKQDYEVLEESAGKKDKIQDFLELLKSKPEKITEKEVTVHREKKICLVCKGKALKFTYICPECEALYCQNCAKTLSNLENMCWVCDTPFDESKPVKSFKEEKEDIEITLSEEAPKKPKK